MCLVDTRLYEHVERYLLLDDCRPRKSPGTRLTRLAAYIRCIWQATKFKCRYIPKLGNQEFWNISRALADNVPCMLSETFLDRSIEIKIWSASFNELLLKLIRSRVSYMSQNPLPQSLHPLSITGVCTQMLTSW